MKVKASGTGTLTTIVWMALPMPPPGRSGLRSLMTPVTQGDVFAVYKMQNDDSDFTKKEHENLKATFLHVTQDIIVMCLLLFPFHTQRSFVSHFYKSWFTWHQPGGSKSGHHLRRLLESILRHPEYLQGLPLWAA